jgi:serine protease Do
MQMRQWHDDGCKPARMKTDFVEARARITLAAGALAVVLAVAILAPAPLLARGGPQSVAPIAEKLIDAVVNISTSQTVKSSSGQPLPSVPRGSPFEEFFEDFFNKRGDRRQQGDRKVSSLGSGFVIDAKEGLIVTNNHVIEGADEIVANFNDGSKLKIDKVLGRDAKTDLALLKVTPGKKPLVSVPFGSAEKMKVGDWVMAIGNPFGLGGSVTVGVISAKQRDLNGPYDEYLQTDASINKGNSGGPLFNMDGEVIGVNTAIISPSGGSIGIGFAVPSDNATVVIDQLRQFGETRRGWLGVRIQTVTEEIAEAAGIRENSGALIAGVTDASPAAKAGIVESDIILRFDGKEVSTMRGLPRLVAQTPIGKEVEVEFLRKGERKRVKLAVGRLVEDDDKEKKSPQSAKPDEQGKSEGRGGDQSLFGLKVAPLTDDLRKKFNIDAKVKGVVVTEADPQAPAAKKGVKAGDVIVEVAQDAVQSADDMARSIDKVRKSGRKAVLLRVEDGKGELRFVAVPLE